MEQMALRRMKHRMLASLLQLWKVIDPHACMFCSCKGDSACNPSPSGQMHTATGEGLHVEGQACAATALHGPYVALPARRSLPGLAAVACRGGMRRACHSDPYVLMHPYVMHSLTRHRACDQVRMQALVKQSLAHWRHRGLAQGFAAFKQQVL